MKNIKSLLVIASLFFTINMVNGQAVSANVEVVMQTQSNWCWAANSECVLRYYGVIKKQCEIVNFKQAKTTCCTGPSSCNQTSEMPPIQKIITDFGGIASKVYTGALSVSQITTILGDKRPFIIGCMWSAGGGHVLVGCAYNSSTSKLTVMDPWQNNGMTTSTYTGGTAITMSGSAGTWKEGVEVTAKPNSTGVNEVANLSGIDVYPSLVTNALNISVPSATGIYNVAIYNYLGTVVKQASIAGKTSTVDISSLTNGMYFVKVIDAQNAQAIFRIVKN